MKLFRIALALAALSTAAHAEAPAPPKATTVAKGDADKFLAFFDKLADTVVADKADCSKMATDLNAQIDANKDLLAKAKQAQDSGAQLPDDAKKRMMATAQRMMGAMMEKCSKDKGVEAAFQRLPHGNHGAPPPAK